MYQSLPPVVAGSGVLGAVIVRDTPLASGALAVTGISLAVYVAVAVVLILVGVGLRAYARITQA